MMGRIPGSFIGTGVHHGDVQLGPGGEIFEGDEVVLVTIDVFWYHRDWALLYLASYYL